MKGFLILILFSIVGHFNKQNDISYFEHKLNFIATNFAGNIFNKSECEYNLDEAKRLLNDIEKEIDDNKDNSSYDIITLNDLKSKSDALVNYIAVLANIDTYIITMDQLNVASKLCNASYSNINSGKYCANILFLKIRKYKAYLAFNNTGQAFTFKYRWKSSNSTNISGNGYMGLGANYCRLIVSNAKYHELGNVTFSNLSCKNF